MLHPQDEGELQNYIGTVSTEKLVLLEFTAKWCRPCKKIHPDLVEIAETNAESVAFVEVDTDLFQEVDWVAQITSLPTFRFIKNGEIVHQFSGAGGAPDTLRAKIEELK